MQPETKHIGHVLRDKNLNRRRFLTTAFAMGSAWALGRVTSAAPPGTEISGSKSKPRLETLVEFTDSGKRQGTVMVEKVVKTDEEWKQVLTPEQFGSLERRERSALSRASIGTITKREFTGAFAVTTRFSIRVRNTNRGRDGRASGPRLLQKISAPRVI